MLGLLENAGIGKEAPVPESFAVKNLMENCLERNLALFDSLKDDQWQEELHKATLADAALGR